ncbi:MAG TPA: hypothetical protein VGX70_10615 [Gemmataceae bacterium]|jgi:hypothetical protein|nr:hypothetical protein [Gemmataceae bacterium]
MLSDRMRQLLTAYVDGELPARQQEAATRLLEQSAEARIFVQHLQADSAALRRLPRRQLGQEFAQELLIAIGDSGLPTAPRSKAARLTRAPVYPAWIGLASAAAVLFVIGVGSALYFYALPSKHDRVQIAKNDGPSAVHPSHATSAVDRNSAPSIPAKNQTTPETEPPSTDKNDAPVSEEKRPILEFTADANIATEAPPIRRLEVFNELEQVKLALNLTLRELDQPRFQERLRQKLKEDAAFQLDMSCPVSAKGLDRLESAFRAKGVKVLVDRAALTRWQKGLKTHYAFYSEDLTPEDLAGILLALGDDDKKAEAKQRFNKIVINHLTPANRGELCTLLGVDPRAKPAKPKGPLGVDITQPLSKKTEEQVADALAGKGPPRPQNGKTTAPKAPDRLALVLSYNPVRISPAGSKEIKQFLATRFGQRPGAVQVLLVLRSE